MSTKLEERLSWLSHVKDANNIRVLGEGGKKVRVVWRGSEAEKGRRVRHSLLSFCRRHTASRRAYERVSKSHALYIQDN